MPPPDLFAWAVAAGVMFAEPRVLDHDGWVSAACHAAASVTAREAGDAFLASLTSRRMDLRSALPSYVLIRLLPEHPYAQWGREVTCAVCGMLRDRDGVARPVDLNDFSQSRFGWGGALRDSIQYAAFDLEQFARAPRLEPAGADIAIGQQVIGYLRGLPPKATAKQAAAGLTMLPGTRSDREGLMDMLGVCGILHAPGHPGYSDAFIPARHASTSWPSQRFPFGHYTTWWWKAEGGISDDVLRRFLPQLA